MKLNLLKITFVFTLLFAFDISADKKIPPLEKDLYLKGSTQYSHPYSKKDYGVDLLIRLFNDYNKKTVASDIYIYFTDESSFNRNRFKKALSCETEYAGDGNEFIDINYYSTVVVCTRVEGELELEGFRPITIERSNLSTRFYLSVGGGSVRMNEIEFTDQEVYKKLYQQLDDKHQAYMKKIEGESLL